MDEIKTEEKINPLSIIDRAEAAAKAIEAANLKSEELLKRQEEIIAKNLLGGRSEAGTAAVTIDPETEKKNKLRNYWKGSAIEQAFA